MQRCTDSATTPLRDLAADWPEAQSPYRTVARLHVPAQTAWSEKRRTVMEDTMFFSPWHGLAAHRPLGPIGRARLPAYNASSQFRAARNATQMTEPICPFNFR